MGCDRGYLGCEEGSRSRGRTAASESSWAPISFPCLGTAVQNFTDLVCACGVPANVSAASCVMMRVAVLLRRGCGRGTLVQAEMVDRLFEFLKKPSIKGVCWSSAGAAGRGAKPANLQLRRMSKVL
jgi:hypothetical protein